MYFGCHLSTSAGLYAMVRTAEALGGNTFAYFTRNPRGSKAKQNTPEDMENARQALKAGGFGKPVAHGAYTMNLCTADPAARGFAAELLADDLRRSSVFPESYYNFHPGSHVGQGTQAGIRYICQALEAALQQNCPVTVLLETMAGKGSEIGGSFQELQTILRSVRCDRVGVCMDTCHVFDAGYDIVNNLEGVLEEFDRRIGLDRLHALHLNDSLNPMGSRKDRHACIGQGYIGLDAFAAIVNHPALKQKPMILETPNTLPGYAEEIRLLRSMQN